MEVLPASSDIPEEINPWSKLFQAFAECFLEREDGYCECIALTYCLLLRGCQYQLTVADRKADCIHLKYQIHNLVGAIAESGV
jgi:hypothetical protein